MPRTGASGVSGGKWMYPRGREDAVGPFTPSRECSAGRTRRSMSCDGTEYHVRCRYRKFQTGVSGFGQTSRARSNPFP
eukprot:2735560-Rhodomonas_salina.1